MFVLSFLREVGRSAVPGMACLVNAVGLFGFKVKVDIDILFSLVKVDFFAFRRRSLGLMVIDNPLLAIEIPALFMYVSASLVFKVLRGTVPLLNCSLILVGDLFLAAGAGSLDRVHSDPDFVVRVIEIGLCTGRGIFVGGVVRDPFSCGFIQIKASLRNVC